MSRPNCRYLSPSSRQIGIFGLLHLFFAVCCDRYLEGCRKRPGITCPAAEVGSTQYSSKCMCSILSDELRLKNSDTAGSPLHNIELLAAASAASLERNTPTTFGFFLRTTQKISRLVPQPMARSGTKYSANSCWLFLH